MAHYRAYFLQRDNSISTAIDLDCESDGHAIETITGMGSADPIEVWQGTRRVGKIEPQARPSN